MKAAALIALTAVALAGTGCSKTSSDARGNSAAATDPLKAAFVGAFPDGATDKNESGATLTYTAKKLVPVVSDGSVQALISNGSQGDDAGHIQLGSLRITYLDSSGDAFTQPQPQIQKTIDGEGFGQPPDWKVIKIHHTPAIRVAYSYTDQGCTDTAVAVYLLESSGIHLDKRASQPSKEVCENQPSDKDDADADADTASGAGDNSSATTSDDGAAAATPATTDPNVPQ